MKQITRDEKEKGAGAHDLGTYSNLHKKRLIRGYDMDILAQVSHLDDDFGSGNCTKCGTESKRLFAQKGRAGKFCSGCVWTTTKRQTTDQGNLSDRGAATDRGFRIRLPFCCGCGSGEKRIGSIGLLCVGCVELMRGLDGRAFERFLERIAGNVKRRVRRCV